MIDSVVFETLVDAVGTPQMGNALLEAARVQWDVDEVFGFQVVGKGDPVALVTAGRTGSSRARAAMYSDGFHEGDPLITSLFAAQPSRTLFCLTMSSDIPQGAYRTECFERPQLGQKLSFFRRWSDRRIAINFYRHGHREPHEKLVKDLAKLAEIALPMLRRHHDLRRDDAHLPFKDRLQRRIASAFPGLTTRECEVSARTLLGMTAEAIALDLSIKRSSVLTYRTRAYERLGVSCANQLLTGLLD